MVRFNLYMWKKFKSRYPDVSTFHIYGGCLSKMGGVDKLTYPGLWYIDIQMCLSKSWGVPFLLLIQVWWSIISRQVAAALDEPWRNLRPQPSVESAGHKKAIHFFAMKPSGKKCSEKNWKRVIYVDVLQFSRFFHVLLFVATLKWSSFHNRIWFLAFWGC